MYSPHERSFRRDQAYVLNRKFTVMVVLLLLLFPFLAKADDAVPPHVGITGFYLFADDDRNASNKNFGWQINPGWNIDGNWWVEGHLFGDVIDYDDGITSDFYQYGIGADLQYAFGDRNELTPYLLIGAGASYNDVTPSQFDDWDYFANVGVGVTKRLWDMESLRWRLEARAVYDNFQSGFLDYRLAAGIELVLGKHKPASAPAPVEIREKVVTREVVREVPVAMVQDLDSDGDGVVDSRDKCPGTPRGAKVDGDGCVLAQTLTLRDVTFDFNSSRLTLNGQRILDTVVAFLRADPKVNLTVGGHTDGKGSAAYNLKLSQARAESVRNYLVEKGISAARLDAKGYGMAHPVASNDTEEGREANRRVELVIKKSGK